MDRWMEGYLKSREEIQKAVTIGCHLAVAWGFTVLIWTGRQQERSGGEEALALPFKFQGLLTRRGLGSSQNLRLSEKPYIPAPGLHFFFTSSG